MLWPDRVIRRHAQHDGLIRPFQPERLQPASYDLALASEFIVFDAHEQAFIDLAKVEDKSAKRISKPDGFLLHPGEFVLGATVERITLPNYVVARLEGKSSIGRLGVLIHVTAGFVDPGWDGVLTLEIYNVRKVPIILRPGLPFCQISFMETNGPVEKPYQGRYQGSDKVDPSKGEGEEPDASTM